MKRLAARNGSLAKRAGNNRRTYRVIKDGRVRQDTPIFLFGPVHAATEPCSDVMRKRGLFKWFRHDIGWAYYEKYS